jgi:hypothetical protein
MVRTDSSVALLRAGGFQDGPHWPSGNDPDAFARFLSEIPTAPGVYAFIVNDQVHYLGKAQKQGIRNRLRKYTIAKSRGPTADRIRSGIAQALIAGHKVRVLYLTPATKSVWRDNLPINLIDGIEAGLIQELLPIWNMRGRGRDEENEEEIAGVSDQ